MLRMDREKRYFSLLLSPLSALNIEGIYRISAFKNALDKIKTYIDSGEEFDVNTVEVKDSSLVAGLLKTFLRCLPEPLFTFKLFKQFVAVTGNNHQMV